MVDLRITYWDLLQFSDQLKSERLFIHSEQTHLQELNSKVVHNASQLAQLAWVRTQQRINLDRLILARPDCLPHICCLRANTLDQTEFVDAFKVLGYHESTACGKLFQALRQCPKLLASCLAQMDRMSPDKVPCLVNCIISGLYANCLVQQDELNILYLLQELTVLQLVPSPNPRRLLRHGTCAFFRMYTAFLEGLFPAKVFLTAALHEPIMKLLIEDDNFLDIDPDKAHVRFPPEERQRLFGTEGTPEYQTKVACYRQWSINKLCKITKRFIDSLFRNISCFPSCLSWLIKHIYTQLSNAQNISEKEVFTISMDLIFTHFVCPAICNPEPYGITEASISYIARFNLMQVGQLLQMLALVDHREPLAEPKLADIYAQFEKDSVTKFIDLLLTNVPGDIDETHLSKSKLQDSVVRVSAFFTETEINSFVTMLHQCSKHTVGPFRELKPLLGILPESFLLARGPNLNNNNVVDVPKKMSALNKVQVDTNEELSEEEQVQIEKCLVFPLDAENEFSVGLYSEQKVLAMLKTDTQSEIIDIQCERNLDLNETVDELEGEVPKSDEVDGKDVQGKRTRFSLDNTNDVGNASDNLDAASEAASNHSASSLELENDNENDNLSDMVSANVSGWGSPNISEEHPGFQKATVDAIVNFLQSIMTSFENKEFAYKIFCEIRRDTPSSQITEGDEGGVGGSVNPGNNASSVPPPPPVKQPRFDLDDKFGKFEIKTLMAGERDETVSMVSDTWSTDALASDAENIDQQTEQRSNPLNPLPPEPIAPSSLLPHMLDTVSETASEAWSTDVAASDSERLIEVETDDTLSITTARSDETGRSEVESRGDPENEDTVSVSGSVSGASIRSGRSGISGRDIAPPTPSMMQEQSNVTGQGGGKAEYRRRTFEFVDSNRRDYNSGFSGESSTTDGPTSSAKSVVDKPSRFVEKFSAVVSQRSSLMSSARMSQFRSQPSTSSQEVSIDEDKGVCVSNVSLASSGSSGSESRAKSSELSPPVVANGSIPALNLPSPSNAFFSKAIHSSNIPKSISFDKSADKETGSSEDDPKNKKGLFRFRIPTFKNRRSGKFGRGNEEFASFETGGISPDGVVMSHPAGKAMRRVVSEDSRSSALSDTSEDILAKYRKKPKTKASPSRSSAYDAASESSEMPRDRSDNADNVSQLSSALSQVYLTDQARSEASGPIVEFSPFEDAKKKLRLVLSNADSSVPLMRNVSGEKENVLVSFLQIQLAEAINLQDRAFIAHLHETLRCIKNFDNEGVYKLFESMKEEYTGRAPYISYLVRCRQSLLTSMAYIERLNERVKCDKDVGYKFLVSLCVRLFLERRDVLMTQFTEEFKQLTMPDEKNDLLDNFMTKLFEDLEKDEIFYYSNSYQLSLAKLAIDRAVIAHCYHNAMFPNGDGDISRDQVLHAHMKSLAKVITPDHKDLRIPKIFHSECPWPSAQAEIAAISSYKTAHDKVQCVYRTLNTILNLLSLATVAPAADDLIPVLVYVLIKANPPSLLSTVQYVNSFYANKMEGEVQYWWVQFSSAIEFIKTMDYMDQDDGLH